MNAPQSAAPVVEMLAGVSAAAPGVLWLHESRTIVAADVHFGYEDVIGAALPMWSTAEIVRVLLAAVKRLQAREIVLLGDVVHASRMSGGAARAVSGALDALRAAAALTLIAGNHEGRTRGAAVLGETAEFAYRDGWLLLHGDKPPRGAQLYDRCIIGHLHPSLPLARRESAPAFLVTDRLVVVPALTPYSAGLNVFSDDCLRALQTFGVRSRIGVRVVAAAQEVLYPFGELAQLREALKCVRPT